MNEEVLRNDDPFWSANVIMDKDGKMHFYNPAITLEEFNKQELTTE